ncbi:Uncharacterised protein [Burkholderia pseudomallei]|nr:Uncharacterised protein [Burkholderia pseudomallei]
MPRRPVDDGAAHPRPRDAARLARVPRGLAMRLAGGRARLAVKHVVAVGVRRLAPARELAGQIPAIGGDDGEPAGHRLPADLQRVGDRRQIPLRIVVQERDPVARVVVEPRAIPRRQHEHVRPRVGFARPGLRGHGGRCVLLEHEVRVQPARARRRDARAARHPLRIDTRARPVGERGIQLERQCVEIDVGIRRAAHERRRQLPVPQRQQHLRQLRHAGDGLAVPDVRLDRADPVAAVGALARAEHARERGHLDRVAHRRTVRGRLDVSDAARIDAGLRERRPHHRLLLLLARHPEAVHPAVLVDGAAAYHAVDRIAVLERAPVILQDDRADALARHVAEPAARERRALGAARQHLHLRELLIIGRVKVQIDRAGDRDALRLAAQILARLVDRDERRRAVAVERDGGPVEIEAVRHAVHERGERRALIRLRASGAVQIEALLRHAAEHAGLRPLRARECRRRTTGVLQRVPAGLEKQTLLRIDELGLARRDLEEQRIERAEAVEEAAPLAVRLAVRDGRVRIALVMIAPVPALGRNLRDRTAPGHEIAPERVERRRVRVAAGQTDDRDAVRASPAVRRARARRTHQVVQRVIAPVPRRGECRGKRARPARIVEAERQREPHARVQMTIAQIADEVQAAANAVALGQQPQIRAARRRAAARRRELIDAHEHAVAGTRLHDRHRASLEFDVQIAREIELAPDLPLQIRAIVERRGDPAKLGGPGQPALEARDARRVRDDARVPRGEQAARAQAEVLAQAADDRIGVVRYLAHDLPQPALRVAGLAAPDQLRVLHDPRDVHHERHAVPPARGGDRANLRERDGIAARRVVAELQHHHRGRVRVRLQLAIERGEIDAAAEQVARVGIERARVGKLDGLETAFHEVVQRRFEQQVLRHARARRAPRAEKQVLGRAPRRRQQALRESEQLGDRAAGIAPARGRRVPIERRGARAHERIVDVRP